MAIGTGADTLQNIPAQPFVTDPALFMQMTSKEIKTFAPQPAPGQGVFFNKALPQVGIVAKLLINFVGTVTVAGGASTTGNRWPYGLIDSFVLNANGQNELWNCDGLDLAVLRDLRYPAYVEAVDAFPGTVGGGDSVANGAYTLSLTWEVPIAMDDVTLIGSLFAQSSSSNLNLKVTQALNTALFPTIVGTVAIAGTFNLVVEMFEVPYNDKGELVVPDLSRLHGFNANVTPLTGIGRQSSPLIRSQGQLCRLLVSADASAILRLSGLPSAATTKQIDAIAFKYGLNQRPYDFDPAALLLSLDNQWYGRPSPYDRLVFDFVKENPARDTILMGGITEPNVEITVDSTVTLTSAAGIRCVQETLF